MADTPSFEDLVTDLTSESDVNNEAVEAQDTTTEDSSSGETKAPEVVEPTSDAESEDDSESSEAKEDDTTDDTEEQDSEEQPQGKAEERKQQLNTEIRDLVTQRRDLLQEVERLNTEIYAPQSVDDIMAETGQSQADARITAMEQRQELADYTNRVAETQLVLESESSRVMQDFPVFNPESAQYNAQLHSEAAVLLQQSLQYDPNTKQVVGSSVSPYQLYKTIASANQASAVENQIKGQRAAEKQLAAVDSQGSAVPKQPKEDPFLEGLRRGLDT